MCSLQLPMAMFGPDAEAALVQVVGDVAERSFFAYAERCDLARFEEAADAVPRWYCATIRFDEGAAAGMVECVLPEDLASALFDAFSGRDAADPAPEHGQVADLIGEFANMICGAWLTRAANGQTFTLRPPHVVADNTVRPDLDQATVTLAVNDRPMAVSVRLSHPDDILTAGVA